MGQTLLWIELLAASCLMVAVATVDGARRKHPWLRWVVIVTGVLVPLGCWAVVTYIAIWLRVSKRIGPTARPVLLSVLAGMFIIIATITLRRGMRNRQATLWSAWKLNLVFAAACVLSLMTFWNLDLNAKNQLGRLRARAGSIVVATFPSRIPEAQNAARVYEQAFESFGMLKKRRIFDWAIPMGNWLDSPQWNQPATRPSDARIREILKANAQGLNQLRRAAAMKQCSFVGYWDWADLASTLLPQVSNMRSAAELLAGDARIRAIDGDFAGAIADLNALFAMSEHITREPTIITALTAMAVESRGIEAMEIVLAGNSATTAGLLSLKLDPLFSHGRIVRAALRGEEAMGLSILATLSDPGYHSIPRRYLPELLIPMYRVFLMDDEIRGYNTAVQEWRHLATMPYHRAREQWKSLPRQLMERRTGFLTYDMIPVVSAYPDRAAEGDAKYRLAILAAAMTICRIKTGALPESIDKLSPEYIEIIPIDPFDGKPLRMARNSHGGAILYSVGPDLEDDGGKTMDKNRIGDVVFRLVAKK